MDIFTKIKSEFDNAESIVLLPHINADGDAAGSCFALAEFLKKLGKHTVVMFEEETDLTNILPHDYSIFDKEAAYSFDLAVAVDCADTGRMGERAALFCGKTICIDHHKTSEKIAEINYTEPDSAATGELIFELISHTDKSLLDTKTAEFLYMAIAADTGCFKYSNVTARTHAIAANLYEIGGRFDIINRKIFDTVPLEIFKFRSQIARDTEFFSNGRIGIYVLLYDEFEQSGLKVSDVGFVSSMIKTIEGVSVSVFIHEREPGKFKVSMRSDETADVASIAAIYGGGGHARAAGFSFEGAHVCEFKKKIIKAIEESK